MSNLKELPVPTQRWSIHPVFAFCSILLFLVPVWGDLKPILVVFAIIWSILIGIGGVFVIITEFVSYCRRKW